MQIVESSVFGLRSARMTFRNAETGQAITLYPMIHVAEPDFYREVFAQAFDHDVALTEGVNSRIVSQLTRSYRWMLPSGSGLVQQNPATPEGGRAKRIHADITPEEFDAHWRDLPWRLRLFMAVAPAAYGLWNRLFFDRERIGKGLTTDDLMSRDEIIGWSPETAGFTALLLDMRDRRLVETLHTTVSTQPRGTRIAIVYGARHMPAVLAALPGLDFTRTASEWMTVWRY